MRLLPRTQALLAVVSVPVLLAGCGTPAADPAAPAAAPSPPPAATSSAHGGGHTEQVAALRTGERFSTLTVPREYEPKAPPGASDEYRCFLVDPGLRAPAYLTGTQFLPSNPDLLHHATLYRVSGADVAAARQKDASTPGDGWTCFGNTGIGAKSQVGRVDASDDWVGAWTPGTSEGLDPAGTGFVLGPGTMLVMQLHYNLLAARGDRAVDRPSVRLRLLDGKARVTPLTTTLLSAPVELPCPAGESGRLCDREAALLDVMSRFGPDAGSMVAALTLLCSPAGKPVTGAVQRCDHEVRYKGKVYAVTPHMHLLGKSLKVELNPGTPAARTLVDVRTFNFHDQRPVPLTEPVQVAPGDTLRVTCMHDAALRSQPGTDTPPRYVVWGDGTTDEMCLGIAISSRD